MRHHSKFGLSNVDHYNSLRAITVRVLIIDRLHMFVGSLGYGGDHSLAHIQTYTHSSPG